MKIYYNGQEYEPYNSAIETLRHCMVTEGVCGFNYPFFAPGGYGSNWWQLDSSSALEGWKWNDFTFAKQSLLNFAHVQKEDGRIPLYGPDKLPVSPHHPLQSDGASSLPTLFPAAYDIAMASGDRQYAENIFQMMAKYSDWWQENRLDPETGLISSLFEETFPPYLGRSMEYSGVDTCVLVALGAENTAKLASILGYKDKELLYRERSRAIFAAAEKYLWDEKTGLFRPRMLKGGKFGISSAEGFYMFADPELPADRKERMLGKISGPDFGWDLYPLCSVSKSAPEFCITRGDQYQFNESWSGMVWSMINRWTVYGLCKAEKADFATKLAEKTVSLIGCDCREFYDPEKGDGHGARDYAWTASHLITLLIETMLGIHYDGFGKMLTVEPAVPGDWEITSLCCGTNGYADISICGGKVTSVRFHDNPEPVKYSSAMTESNTIKTGRYRHFKGKEYRVLYVAKHSETLEPMVVYQALYGEGGIWVRPASMWNETVERDGKIYKRFEYLGE